MDDLRQMQHKWNNQIPLNLNIIYGHILQTN